MPDPYPTIQLGGPRWRRLYQEPPEYVVVKGPKYADGGQDTFLASTTPIRRWVIDYEGLKEAEAAILDGHFDSSNGPHLGFDFTDPHTGVTYTNVKYLDYERPPHNRRAIQSRRVRLEKRP